MRRLIVLALSLSLAGCATHRPDGALQQFFRLLEEGGSGSPASARHHFKKPKPKLATAKPQTPTLATWPAGNEPASPATPAAPVVDEHKAAAPPQIIIEDNGKPRSY